MFLANYIFSDFNKKYKNIISKEIYNMFVNKIQYSPQFTSLRFHVTPKFEENFIKLPPATLDKIDEAGEKLGQEEGNSAQAEENSAQEGEKRGTRYYHVEVDENLKCKLVSNVDAYFGLFEVDGYLIEPAKEDKNKSGDYVPSDRIIYISDSASTDYMYEVVKDSEQKDKFKMTYTLRGPKGLYSNIDDIDKFTQVALMLDKVAAEKYKEAAIHKKRACNLLNRFRFKGENGIKKI